LALLLAEREWSEVLLEGFMKALEAIVSIPFLHLVVVEAPTVAGRCGQFSSRICAEVHSEVCRMYSSCSTL
jgi:hypothetical protein